MGKIAHFLVSRGGETTTRGGDNRQSTDTRPERRRLIDRGAGAADSCIATQSLEVDASPLFPEAPPQPLLSRACSGSLLGMPEGQVAWPKQDQRALGDVVADGIISRAELGACQAVAAMKQEWLARERERKREDFIQFYLILLWSL